MYINELENIKKHKVTNKPCSGTLDQGRPDWPGRDVQSGSARSCWGPTGWVDWVCSVLDRSWSWTWAYERGWSGVRMWKGSRRRPSWGERTRLGPQPAGRRKEEPWLRPSLRCRRRSWCSRSLPLSGTDPNHCGTHTDRESGTQHGPDLTSSNISSRPWTVAELFHGLKNSIPSCFIKVVLQIRNSAKVWELWLLDSIGLYFRATCSIPLSNTTFDKMFWLH